jgi:hypothetical protein
MLKDKTVQVEQNVDAVLTEVKNVVLALKQGKSVAEVALAELLKLQSVVQAVQGSVNDVKESLPAAIRTVLLDAEELALVVLGVPQPL